MGVVSQLAELADAADLEGRVFVLGLIGRDADRLDLLPAGGIALGFRRVLADLDRGPFGSALRGETGVIPAALGLEVDVELRDGGAVAAADLEADTFGVGKVQVDLVIPIDACPRVGAEIAVEAEDVGDVVLPDAGRRGAFDGAPSLGGGGVVGVVAGDDGFGGAQGARREQGEEEASHQRAWISASSFSRPWP